MRVSASGLHDTVRRDIIDAFSDEKDKSLLRSPDVLDLVIWNVVISFIVNISASATYEFFRDRIREGRRITEQDLHEQRSVLLEEVEVHALSEQLIDEVDEAVGDLYPNLSPQVRRTIWTKMITRTRLETREHR